MRIVIVYATTEGQTRKITRFAADRYADAGHSVELLNAADAAGLDPGRFDAAILAGSVHAGFVQPALRDFAERNAEALSRMPTLYLQVSLAAAGTDAEEWADLERIAKRTFDASGWTPGHIEHVAGAFRFGEYDFFKAWAMRWIASQKDPTVDTHGDTEYTDWAALGQALDAFAAQAASADPA